MLFRFLRYLQPTSYFSLLKHNGQAVFPNIENLPSPILKQLTPDALFKSEVARTYDLSWQALHMGFIGDVPTIPLPLVTLPVVDEYRFVRKYFHFAWVLYVFLVRLLSFNNPFAEFQAFYQSKNTTRSSYLSAPIVLEGWNSYQSENLKAYPKVSVIIPTLNRYPYLKDVLDDLVLQTYPNFDVIVVDQSEPFDADFYRPFDLDLKVIQQTEKALWQARNTAVRSSDSALFLFFDDDSRVAPDWITSHLKCLDYFEADLSSGVSISKVGASVPPHYSFFRLSDQLDTGNVMLKREVFETIGLFDCQFEKQRMGDGEFGLRAYLAGYTNVSNPMAKRLHLKVDSGGLRQMGSWDAFRTQSWFDPRPIPSVLYFFRRYFGNTQARWALLRTVPVSIMPYRFKKNKPLMLLGILMTIVLLPLVVFQVLKSWHLASRKLKEGPLIERLEV